ncbi:serine/threonine protein kinase [Enhygromyxa salina]|uniref:Serine/threonine protein kinase n=1 Tax=Enhygromyxa salina TaxID=215803 RepID=A0A0C1ZKX1_9BACT|nr:serine/threonine-protein kinase [Enhygromyxa salina]KIG18179.1 serine/threonine protein kinase [Enhygromyxa salina]
MLDSSANANPGSGPEGDPSQASRVLGKYQLLRLLARGGMGEVYLARLPGELGFEKLLVVKTIRPDLAADPRFVELFAAEAKTAVGLSHPNITPIYELGRADDGTLYTAMGWVDGPSLSLLGERLRELNRSLPLDAALFIVREILDGLAHAHSPGRDRQPVVHRDVTPRNVLVDRSGRVQIVDFGIAKPANTEAVGAMGSAGYMAPEQARGELVDPRADVFSVGCVLYELVTGERAIASEGVWMVPELDEVPPQLHPLLERALAIDPESRFADADRFLRALAPILAELAPVFATRDLAAILRELFPDDWQTEAHDPSDGSHTPATQITGAVKTFATRLRPTTTPELGTDPELGLARAVSLALAVDPPPLHDATSGQANRPPPNDAKPGQAVPLAVDADGEPPRRRAALWSWPAVVVVLGSVGLIVQLAGAIGYAVARSERSTTDQAAASGRPDGLKPTDPQPTDPQPPADVAHDRVTPDLPRDSAPALVPDPPPPSPTTLALRITPANARVWVDRQALAGPPFLVQLSGDAIRELVVEHDGHHPKTLALDPRALPPDPIVITLAPLALAQLSVVAPSVSWAEVWLDGAKIGTTPLTDKTVREGRHKLQVRCTAAVCGEDRMLLERNIQLRAGRATKVAL